MTFLTQHISFAGPSSQTTTALPAAGTHTLITDTLTSPANFVLYHFVSSAIAKKQKIIWVDFRNDGRSSWETVLKKMGSPIPVSGTQFVHISPRSFGERGTSTEPLLFDDDGSPSLRSTYDAIISQLSGSYDVENGPVILLDGLAELLWMGFNPEEISRFTRAIVAKARASNSVVISTLHADHLPLTAASSSSPPSNELDLLERLLRISNDWIRVSGLASGRSGDVHGEISSHPLISGNGPSIPRSKPLQYRLEASTVKVFPKGTGRGFL